MSKFEIIYRNGYRKVYNVVFSPWPTWRMLNDLAESMLVEKGGIMVRFSGPNGLSGSVGRS